MVEIYNLNLVVDNCYILSAYMSRVKNNHFLALSNTLALNQLIRMQRFFRVIFLL